MSALNLSDNVNILFLFYTADLTDNTQKYYIYFILLPICTVATVVKWMFKYWSKFLDVIRILLDSIFFEWHISVLSFPVEMLSVVLGAKYCGISDSTDVPGEEYVYFSLNLNVALSCQHGPQLVVTYNPLLSARSAACRYNSPLLSARSAACCYI
jgi:hypothetical protein